MLGKDPFSGHVFCFRGRRGDLVKLLWWDGDGLCLFAKGLESGRFVWPRCAETHPLEPTFKWDNRKLTGQTCRRLLAPLLDYPA